MFDLDALRAAVALRGRVVRVVIAAHDGSSPREAGAAMLVWADLSRGGGQSGTVGGGALEWAAVARARGMLAPQGAGGEAGGATGCGATPLTETTGRFATSTVPY